MRIRTCLLTAAALGAAAVCSPAAEAGSIRVPLDRAHPGPREDHGPVRGRPPHRPLAAAARADRGLRGRPGIRVDRLGEHVPLHAREAPSPARPDRDGPARHGVVGRDRLPGAPGRDPALRRRPPRRARGGWAGRRAPTGRGPSPTTWRRSCAGSTSRRSTSTATPTAPTPPRCSPSAIPGAPGLWSSTPRSTTRSIRSSASGRRRCGRPGGRYATGRAAARDPRGDPRAGGQARRHPIVGTGDDADGVRRHVRLGPVELAELVYDATYTYTVFRDLPGALAALRHGDRGADAAAGGRGRRVQPPRRQPELATRAATTWPWRATTTPRSGRRATRPPAPGDPRERRPAPLAERVRAVLEARLAAARSSSGSSCAAASTGRGQGSARRRSPAAARGPRCRCSS